MDKRKANFTLAFAMALIVLLSSFAYLEMVSPVHAASTYATVNGVLTSDYYSLYPYTTNSLDMGISQYGEMISQVGSLGVGLQYPGYDVVGTYDQHAGTSADPFANDKIAQSLWLNGWLIDIRYTHRTLLDRHIEAMAMYADMSVAGGSWLVGHALPLDSPPAGGRKTTGYAVTDPMQVLYNGPRSYIALCTNHIYDWKDWNGDGIVQLNETWPIVDVLLTFVFDKVSKEVVIYKDIKQVISGKELASPIDIQFSDREEWDLGPSPDFASYAHFYTQELTTVYNSDYHLAPGIFREEDYKSTGPITSVPIYDSRDPYGPPIANGSVRVYVNGKFWEEGVDYTIDLQTGGITWLTPVLQTDVVEVIYKLCKYMGPVVQPDGRQVVPFTGVPAEYDVAQMISSDLAYVGWKAFWPVLSDYSVMGWSKSFTPLINVSQPDIATGEPDIPFVIGEWDFMLGRGYPVQFRGVEVVGVTDRHDADDINRVGATRNIIDSEVKYQLDMVFNPWSLVDAVHKKASNYVEFTTITSVDETYTTDITNVPVIVKPDQQESYVPLSKPNDWIPDPTGWDQYGVFSERIVANDTVLLIRDVDYGISANGDGTATITFYVTGHMKILYSVMGMYVATEGTNVNVWTSTRIEFNITTDAFPLESLTPNMFADWVAKLKIHAYNVNSNTIPYDSIPVPELDAVYLNGHYIGLLTGTGDYSTVTFAWTTSEFNIPPNFLNSNGTQRVQIFVACNAQSFPITISPDNPATWPTYANGYYGVQVDYGLLEFAPRYEWAIVGRDAKTVDSAGASLVTAAFKDKQVEIGIAGDDMNETTIQNGIPFVFNKFGTGTTMTDYEDSKGRAALRDDWCHTWPVADSNIIGVGGPNINLVAYYSNDFEEAIYGNTYMTYGPWNGAVAALSCWSKFGYYSNSSVGYAAITTYLDINGTVVFNVWGVWGRDTYYACKYIEDELIIEFETFPKGVNSIVLQINYKDPMHPTFSIPETLGTISEHALFESVKGGIHPDP